MLARILATLSLLGLIVLGWFVVSLLHSASRFATAPVWPSRDSPPLRLREGETGTWEPRWEDVPGAECMGLLWLRTDRPLREWKDGTRVLARVTPGSGEWAPLGPEYDFASALRVDPRTLPSIEYRVEHVGDQLLDRRCELTVCGDCDSKAGMYATSVRGQAVMAGFMLGVPLLTVFGLSLAALLGRKRARAA
ncbi:MAG: hypothetical protein IPJ19_18460 [Planctomycetes bacterium]|nr:hypothetical protein [Planctomycetota bacterium]